MDTGFKEAVWTHRNGKTVLIHTMSDGWLNNIRKYLRDNDWLNHPGRDKIINEIKRRKTNRS